MSLFGGDELNEQLQDVSMHDASESDLNDSNDDQDSDEHSHARQPVQEEYETSSAYESDSDDENRDRPNRYKGNPRTWYRYTAQDRTIHTGLQHARANDLSIHLYNVFALTNRYRNGNHQCGPEGLANLQQKRHWMDVARRAEWTPPARWSKWPLPPGRVPDIYEAQAVKTGRNGQNSHTVRSMSVYQELEGIMLGHMLRISRRKWTTRGWDSDETDRVAKKRKTLSNRASRLKLDSSGAEDNESSTTTSASSSEDLDEETGNGSISTTSSDSSERDESDDRAGSEHVVSNIKTRRSCSRSHWTGRAETEFVSGTPSDSRTTDPVIQFSTPGIMADEDKAQRILQPSIHAVISKLERLLLALDLPARSRAAARHDNPGGPVETLSQGEQDPDPTTAPTSDVEASSVPKRGRGRPPKIAPIPDPATTHKRGGGRPSKYTKRLPGESWYMMRQRYAREMAQAETVDDEIVTEQSARSTSRPRPFSKTHKSSQSRPSSSYSTASNSTGSREVRRGLRDWSEVIGAASLCGWNEAVVARAAERCAKLFDESMAFRSLQEHTAMGEAEKTFQYRVDTVPAPEELSDSSDKASTSRRHDEKTKPDVSARPQYDPTSVFCPHEDCRRHTIPFAHTYRVIDHVQKVHGYEPREEEDASSELEGGVHVDGYLRPILRRDGWTNTRGKQEAKSERVREGSVKTKRGQKANLEKKLQDMSTPSDSDM